jgi:hypothetical protein
MRVARRNAREETAMKTRASSRSSGSGLAAAIALGLTALSCSAREDAAREEAVGEQTQALSASLPADAPVLELPPLVAAGCADGTTEQVFAGGIVGCAGAVTYPNRARLCATGYHPLAAMTWRTSRGPTEPTHHYWTDDILNYTGSGTGMCSAEYQTRGTACPANQPMRVCARAVTDPEGNRCNWFNCSFDSGGTTPNHFFGGCAGNTTAGTLCVPDSGCADGTSEQTFPRGMVGCAGRVTLANAASLCAAGYIVGYDTDWLRYRNGAVPTHNYWTGTPPGHYSGTASACVATTAATDPSCPADSPMRICVPGGTDPEGNRCNWFNCDNSSSYSTTTNEYFGGCIGNTTAGALCVPNKMCADGRMEQTWNRFIIGCAGSVGWGNRESLCGPRQIAVPIGVWPGSHGTLAPTHNYWIEQPLLLRDGTATGNCSASQFTGTSCGMDNPMHICTASGNDAEGNHCDLTQCGLDTTTPNHFLGGCGATAGTVCMTGP